MQLLYSDKIVDEETYQFLVVFSFTQSNFQHILFLSIWHLNVRYLGRCGMLLYVSGYSSPILCMLCWSEEPEDRT